MLQKVSWLNIVDNLELAVRHLLYQYYQYLVNVTFSIFVICCENDEPFSILLHSIYNMLYILANIGCKKWTLEVRDICFIWFRLYVKASTSRNINEFLREILHHNHMHKWCEMVVDTATVRI